MLVTRVLGGAAASDTTAPTVAITLSDYAFKTGDTATVTFTFSEAPVGFTVADVTAPNGSLSSFTVTADPLVYTATFTPTAGVTDATNVITVGTGWNDAAGNPPAGVTTSDNYTVDTAAPTVAITSSASDPTATSPIPVTVTFSEAVTGFVVGDLTVGNGSAGDFATSDNIIFTANITPTAGGAVTVDIAAGVCTDAAGNGNTAATQFSIIYAPTFAVVFDGTNTYLMLGSEGTLDDIQDNAFTAEGWFKITASAAGLTRPLIEKVGASAGTVGWGLYYNTAKFGAQVACLTASAWREFSATPHDSTWHHFALTWDDAGDRKVRIYVDGAEPGSYNLQDVTGNGAIKSDAAFQASIGCAYDTNNRMTGRTGWGRISNTVRYTEAFTPDARDAPPANDANTLRLFNMDEGTGTTINDSSTNAQDGTLTSGTWAIDPI